MTRQSWVQDPETGKLIPKEEWNGGRRKTQHYIVGDIDGFVSPIDGSIISSRGKLRAHQREHGVTDARDYSPDFMRARAEERVKRAQGQTRHDRQDRINLIRRAMEQ